MSFKNIKNNLHSTDTASASPAESLPARDHDSLMIHVDHASKYFGQKKALDSLCMHVGKGEIYGLAGPNGAGKSTLIRHLAGIYRQDEGRILIDGQIVYENTSIKSRIAYIPDDIFYFLQANIDDMKKFYKGLYPAFDTELFDRLGKCFPAINRKQMIRSMSKGMQKQAAFWLALCIRGDLMILDEPVDGLDPIMRRQIWSLLMKDVADRGTTILLSSHNLRELEDVCDHVGIMDRGRLLLEKSLSDLQECIGKFQIAFPGDLPEFPENLDILHRSSMGRVHTLIIRGDRSRVRDTLMSLSPLLLDAIPLTLEEIFMYEIEGEDYAVKDLLF